MCYRAHLVEQDEWEKFERGNRRLPKKIDTLLQSTDKFKKRNDTIDDLNREPRLIGAVTVN